MNNKHLSAAVLATGLLLAGSTGVMAQTTTTPDATPGTTAVVNRTDDNGFDFGWLGLLGLIGLAGLRGRPHDRVHTTTVNRP